MRKLYRALVPAGYSAIGLLLVLVVWFVPTAQRAGWYGASGVDREIRPLESRGQLKQGSEPAGIRPDCTYDLDGSGHIDAADLMIAATLWRTSDRRADLDGDGWVDVVDLQALAARWGARCGWPDDPSRFQVGPLTAFWGDPLWHLTDSFGNHVACEDPADSSLCPARAFANARAAGFDWFAISEHDHNLTNAVWDEMTAARDAAEEEYRFVALRSFELTGDYFEGHINVFESESWPSPRPRLLAGMYSWISAQPHTVFAMFNHPRRDSCDPVARTGLCWNFNQWQPRLEHAPRLPLVQNYRNGEYELSLRAGWRPGGVGANEYGKYIVGRAAVMAVDLTHEAIVDALRRGRVFGTNESHPGLALALRGSGETTEPLAWMGESLAASDRVTVTIDARDLAGGSLTTLALVEARACESATAAQRTVSGGQASWTVSVPRQGTALFATARSSRGTQAWSAPLLTTARLERPTADSSGWTTTTILPDRVAAISSWEPDTPHPWGAIAVRSEGAKASLLHFDLSTLPAGVEIAGAVLDLTAVERRGTVLLPFAAFALRRPWDLAEVTWNQAAAGRQWGAPGAASAADRNPAPFATALAYDLGRYSLDVTDLARRWQAQPGQNHGLLLQSLCSAPSAIEYRFAPNPGAVDGPRLWLWLWQG